MPTAKIVPCLWFDHNAQEAASFYTSLFPNSKVDGVAGDPRRSSAELGKLGIDLIVTRSVEAIQKATIRR